MRLGEFRLLTKDLPDDTVILCSNSEDHGGIIRGIHPKQVKISNVIYWSDHTYHDYYNTCTSEESPHMGIILPAIV